MTLNDPEPLK